MMIDSLLDLDLYKLTMMQAVLHRYPGKNVEYEFKCRNSDIDLTPFVKDIKEEVEELCSLKFDKDELNYLNSLPFIKADFVSFLKHFQLSMDGVEIKAEDKLKINIKGSWLEKILFETLILSIVNETYFDKYNDTDHQKIGENKLQDKIKQIKKVPDFKFADFGTRRRFSKQWHEMVIEKLKPLPSFIGTSNVMFAMHENLKPIGTMAHEYLQASQAVVRLVDSQKYALENWAQEYRGDLGIALSDVVGIDAFLRDFDLYFSKLFDGVRHDSGDPYQWCEKIIDHYNKYQIDSKTKTAVFSDGLTVPRALALHATFKNEIKTVFAIGTNLTNDYGVEPLNIVIKMTECDGQPVAKISDSAGKQMCKNEKYLGYLKEVFKIAE